MRIDELAFSSVNRWYSVVLNYNSQNKAWGWKPPYVSLERMKQRMQIIRDWRRTERRTYEHVILRSVISASAIYLLLKELGISMKMITSEFKITYLNECKEILLLRHVVNIENCFSKNFLVFHKKIFFKLITKKLELDLQQAFWLHRINSRYGILVDWGLIKRVLYLIKIVIIWWGYLNPLKAWLTI